MSAARPVYDHVPAKVSGLTLRRIATIDVIENLFYGAATVFAFMFAYVVLRHAGTTWSVLGYLIVFWAVLAYLALPRLHRVLTAIYVPGYFIGRTRTSDGLLGDPVNIALNGTAAQIHDVMRRAGWIEADPVNLTSSVRIVISSLTRRSYPRAPVSPLFLFGERQAFAYQQEVAGNPAQRHHVRFWPCPPGWLLPGGRQVGWLAAGSYDRAVGLSFFTLQVTHRIDRDIDIERDYIVDSVRYACPEVRAGVIEDFSTGYHSRNGGGDSISTDGDLPVLDLSAVIPSSLDETTAADDVLHEVGRRPLSIIAAAVLTAAALISAVTLALTQLLSDVAADPVFAENPDERALAVIIVVGIVTSTYLVLAVLAWLTYLGNRSARVLMLAVLTFSLISSLLQWIGSARPTLPTLIGLTIDILTIYALTSLSAREWTREHGQSARRRARRDGEHGSPR